MSKNQSNSIAEQFVTEEEPAFDRKVEEKPAPKGTEVLEGQAPMRRIEKLLEMDATREDINYDVTPKLGTSFKLQIDPELLDPKYHYAWAEDNDELDALKIQKFIQSGYRFCRGEIGIQADANVGRATQLGEAVTRQCSNGDTLYLMILPIEVWNKRQEEEMRDRRSMRAQQADVAGAAHYNPTTNRLQETPSITEPTIQEIYR